MPNTIRNLRPDEYFDDEVIDISRPKDPMLFLNTDQEESKEASKGQASKKRTLNQREMESYRVTDPQKERQYWSLANQIHPHDQRAKVKVTRAELSSRMKSKLDIYRVLSTEG